jgi:Glycosyl transferases group 1
MKLVFISHTAMGGPFVVGSHHLATALARLGHKVAHVSAPLSPGHLAWAIRDRYVRMRWRRWLRGGETVTGVREQVPLTPLPWSAMRRSRTLSALYSTCMLASPWRGYSGLRLDDADCLIVDEPRFVGLVCAQRHQAIIYRATDLYAQLRADPTVEGAERIVCEHADTLVATSRPVAAHLAALSRREPHLMTNGVDFEHFVTRRAPTWDWSLPGERVTRALYVGAFDGRFGEGALRGAAASLPGKTFILAGPGSEAVSAALARPNVVALGPVKYSLLPDLMQQCSVGLLPLSQHSANAGRSPMKLYEYAAAGLSIAATATAEIRQHALPTLCIAGDEKSFADAVRRAFDASSQASLVDAARTCAAAEGWLRKAGDLAQLAAAACDRKVTPAERFAAKGSATSLHQDRSALG